MNLVITSYCHLHDNRVIVNDKLVFYQENILKFADFIKTVYKQEQITYPKFYKMDSIGKLGFLAAEIVFKERSIEGYNPGKVGVVLSNSSSSLDTDIVFNDSIKDRSGYFPSPSVFVYTLPNIVIGEICIKNGIKGENAFFISESFNGKQLLTYVNELFENNRVDACLCGWVEIMGSQYHSLMILVEKESAGNAETLPVAKRRLFNEENLSLLMIRN
ncbi:MAG: 3-oxoacyl-ACP synthase [Bacteroidota bacterium]